MTSSHRPTVRGALTGIGLVILFGSALVLAQGKTLSNATKVPTKRLITVTLSPSDFRTATSQKTKKGSEFFMTGEGSVPIPSANALYAGYLHDTNGKTDSGSGYDFRNEFYRAAMRFDVSKLVGKEIRTAALTLTVFNAHHRGIHSNPDYWDHVSSCGLTVSNGTERWWTTDNSMIGVGSPSVPIGQSGTSDKKTDVTAIVRAWAVDARSNFGLVLKGDNEDMNAYTETICQTQYVHAGDGAPTLTIGYYQ